MSSLFSTPSPAYAAIQSAVPGWLQAHPQVYPSHVNDYPNVHQGFLEGVPYRGKPTRFFAYWQLPAGASAEHPVPGIVLIHGGGATALPDWVELWNQRGFAAISMDTCGAVPGWSPIPRFNQHWPRHEFSGPEGWGGFDQLDEPYSDQWPWHAIACAILSHSFLRSLPGVDSTRIGVGGISWGGELTLWTAALDHRFQFAIPVYGTGFWEAPESSLPYDTKIPAHFERWQQLWNPAYFLPGITMPLFLLGSTSDTAFPVETLFRTTDAIGDNANRLVRINYSHDHNIPDTEETLTDFARCCVTGRPVPRIRTIRAEGETKLIAEFDGAGRAFRSAEMHFTRASGFWPDRAWRDAPAAIEEAGTVITSVYPKYATAAFLNLIDRDGNAYTSPLFQPGR